MKVPFNPLKLHLVRWNK